MDYFANQEKKESWEREMKRLKEEKSRRQNKAPNLNSISEATSRPERIPITLEKLMEMEFGPQKQAAHKKSLQMEKTKDIGGMSL